MASPERSAVRLFPDCGESGAPSATLSPDDLSRTATPLPTHNDSDHLPLPTVPGYEVLGVLGHGGMGVVYRALQARVGRLVALKMVLAVNNHPGPEQRARFQAEAEALARLRHPNIVQLYEVGEHDGRPFFSLEYVEGGSLDERMNGSLPPVREAAALLETLARAIHAAHQAGIVHRDLKPHNVLLTADCEPKITDFGIAKRLDADRGCTRPDQLLGTPSYMAPEQTGGKHEAVGPFTDVYSLGAILYEMLTGRPPFQGETPLDTAVQVLTAEPVPPRKVVAGVPRDLEAVCLKCLHKEPTRRYASALDLADDLRRFQGGKPTQARSVPAWERALRWVGRHPSTAALAGAVALAMLGGGSSATLYGLYRHQQAVSREKQIAEEGQRQERQQQLDRETREGQAAEDAGQLDAALTHWDRALALLGADPAAGTEDLRRALDEHRTRATDLLHAEAVRRDLRDRIEQFEKDRALVLAHEISITESARAADRAAIRSGAPTALAHLGVNTARESLQAVRQLDAYPPGTAAACYQVLLAWAEAEAVPGASPGDHRHSLHLLDVAAAVGDARHLPTPRAFHLRRARLLALLGDRDGARAERGRAEQVKSVTTLDRFLLALDDYGQGRWAGAAAGCEGILGDEPDHFWAQYLLALCDLRLGDWKGAKAGWTACLGRDPGFFWARMLRATARARLGEDTAAEEDFARALERVPDPLARALLLTNRGALRVRRQEWDGAVADLRQAVALQPDAVEAHANLAQAYRGRKDWEAARAELDQALTFRPGDASLYHSRAALHLERGDPAAARRDFEQAVTRTPPGARSERLASDLVELAHLQAQAGEHEAALASCQAARNAWPDYAPAYRQHAEVLLALGRYAEAGRVLDQYLRTAEPTADVLQVRGLIHEGLRQDREAVAAYDRALGLHTDTTTLIARGRARLKLQAAREALADFRAALDRDPTSTEALLGTARAQLALGRLQAAVRAAEEALRTGRPTRRQLVQVAGVYAQAAGRLRSKPEDAAAAYGYQERAVVLVRTALEQVPPPQRPAFWATHVARDADLAPVRASTGMRELARRHAMSSTLSSQRPQLEPLRR
jgi:tetratricopeptide (TPR) repeat protein